MRQKIVSHNFTLCIILSIIIVNFAGCREKEKVEVIGFPQSFADLAEKVKPAVVNISTTTTVRIPGSPFRHFFGPEESPSDDCCGNFVR